MDVHQRIAGVLLAVVGAFTLVWSLLFASMTLGMHMGAMHHAVQGGGTLWLGLLAGLFALVLTWACAALRAGICLYRGRRSRTIVPAAVLALIGFPLGTAAGAYALWSLWRDGAPKAPPDWQHIARAQQVAGSQT